MRLFSALGPVTAEVLRRLPGKLVVLMFGWLGRELLDESFEGDL